MTEEQAANEVQRLVSLFPATFPDGDEVDPDDKARGDKQSDFWLCEFRPRGQEPVKRAIMRHASDRTEKVDRVALLQYLREECGDIDKDRAADHDAFMKRRAERIGETRELKTHVAEVDRCIESLTDAQLADLKKEAIKLLNPSYFRDYLTDADPRVSAMLKGMIYEILKFGVREKK